MSDNDRQQRFIERVQEDERLRGDLEERAATALVQWATEQVTQRTADPQRPDAEVEAAVQAVRAAARAAARSGETEPEAVVARAAAALAAGGAPAQTTPSATAAAEASGAPTEPTPVVPVSQAAPLSNDASKVAPAAPTPANPRPWANTENVRTRTRWRRWQDRIRTWFTGSRKDS